MEKFEFINLDFYDFKKKQARCSDLKTTLRQFLFISLLFEIILIIFSVLIIVQWPCFYYTWTFIPRIFFFIESIINFVLIIETPDPIKLIGLPYYKKAICFLVRNYGFRIKIIFSLIHLIIFSFSIILIHIIIFAVNNNVGSIQFLLYIILDILFILEFFFYLYIIYIHGIIKNLQTQFPQH
jgi:hypothetical protein